MHHAYAPALVNFERGRHTPWRTAPKSARSINRVDQKTTSVTHGPMADRACWGGRVHVRWVWWKFGRTWALWPLLGSSARLTWPTLGLRGAAAPPGGRGPRRGTMTLTCAYGAWVWQLQPCIPYNNTSARPQYTSHLPSYAPQPIKRTGRFNFDRAWWVSGRRRALTSAHS